MGPANSTIVSANSCTLLSRQIFPADVPNATLECRRATSITQRSG
jgi:hypothetical protein